MRNPAKRFCALAMSGCLTAGMMLTGCAAQTSSESTSSQSSSYESYIEEEADEDVEQLIDLSTWQSFTANAASALYGKTGANNLPDMSVPQTLIRQNTCFSPTSLYYALALCGMGTTGEAQKQILQLMGFESAEEMESFCKNEIEQMEDTPDGYDLELANSVWVQNGYALTDDYANRIQDDLDASVFNVDFGTQEANDQISKWISDETEGLLNPQFTTSEVDIAALINTLYFKDSWTQAFLPENTTTEKFHADGADVDAQFMHTSLDIGMYAEGSNFTASQLGFQGGSTMTFYLPNEGKTVADLMSDATAVQQLLSADFSEAQVNFAVPKFTIDSSFDKLVDTLVKLGVVDIFDPSSAGLFAPMIKDAKIDVDSPYSEFYISDVVQETHIAIDENGAEAAAYTAMSVRATSMMRDLETIDFTLDKPFIYTITDPNGAVLFIGAVNIPE